MLNEARSASVTRCYVDRTAEVKVLFQILQAVQVLEVANNLAVLLSINIIINMNRAILASA